MKILALRFFLFAMGLAILGWALFGCAQYPAPSGALSAGGLSRFYSAGPGIFRSPQPTRDQFIAIQHLWGVKTVIKLNYAWEGSDELPPGMELYADPWLPLGPVSHDMVVATLKDLEQAPKPVLVHCLHGEDRTGLLIMLYRVKHGAPPAVAWAEGRAYGFHDGQANQPAIPALVEVFERETGFDASAWVPR